MRHSTAAQAGAAASAHDTISAASHAIGDFIRTVSLASVENWSEAGRAGARAPEHSTRASSLVDGDRYSVSAGAWIQWTQSRADTR